MLTGPGQESAMTQEEFEMIRDFIHEKSGMFFAESKMYLVQNRLTRRMADLSIKTYRDYFYHVKYDSSQREFQQLMNIMTTNETSFYRNEPQLLSFGSEVLPLIMEQKEKARLPRTIRIWSAGCSTGEEPYTLAMILLEHFRVKRGWTAEIIAHDISESVLQRARRGEYQGITMRNVPAHIINSYFDRNGEVYTVKPAVKALVKFGLINLNDSRMLSLNTNFDAIFCRNVMIYFSDEVKKSIVRGFFNALRPGGFFYIGHSETLHGISKAFKLVYLKNALVYQKEAVGAGATSSSTRPAAATGTIPSTADSGSGAGKAMDLLTRVRAGSGQGQ